MVFLNLRFIILSFLYLQLLGYNYYTHSYRLYRNGTIIILASLNAYIAILNTKALIFLYFSSSLKLCQVFSIKSISSHLQIFNGIEITFQLIAPSPSQKRIIIEIFKRSSNTRYFQSWRQRTVKVGELII